STSRSYNTGDSGVQRRGSVMVAVTSGDHRGAQLPQPALILSPGPGSSIGNDWGVGLLTVTPGFLSPGLRTVSRSRVCQTSVPGRRTASAFAFSRPVSGSADTSTALIYTRGTGSSQTVCQIPVVRVYQMPRLPSCLPFG